MSITAKVIADSVAPSGARLTTFQCRYPRIILAEVNTHKMISKSTASSRAIPVSKMIAQVMDDPFIPLHWGKNQQGMQAAEELDPLAQAGCTKTWFDARDTAVAHVQRLLVWGLHKQIANRPLEPWMWTESIFTATEWGNFFALRVSPAAEPHMQRLATAMLGAYRISTPEKLDVYDWHLPYVSRAECSAGGHPATWLKWSTARCARVSYLNHDGTAPDQAADEVLHDKLLEAGHMSPMEHQGQVLATGSRRWVSGNFHGFQQYRKTIPNENRTHPNVEEFHARYHQR